MKLVNSHLSLAGIFAGIVFGISSFVRYYMWYPNIDKVIAYSLIAGLVVAVSWLYDQNLSQGNELNAIGDYLSDKSQENEK